MPVEYIVSAKENLTKPQEPKKWYANAKSSGSMTFNELSEEMSKRSRINRTDTFIILKTLTEILCDNLAKGKVVRLGDLGSFQIALSSEGAESKNKFNSLYIKKTKVIFRPSTDLY